METMKGKGTKRVTREHVAALHDKARCIASAIVETGRQHIPLLVTAALHDCDGDNCGYGDSELVAQRMRQLDFTTEEKKDEMALVMRRELARPEVDALLFISEAWIATVPAKEGMEGVASLMRAGGVSKAANGVYEG